MSKLATIPDFTDGDVRSMSTALRVMKQQLETLSGQRQGQSRGAPNVYVQATEPRSDTFREGDFWINPSNKKLNYYNGSYWVQL